MDTGKPMRTCWVLDHPAHVRLLAPLLRSGQSNDVIIATQRHEVRALLDTGDGVLPRRQIHWVTRPVGQRRRRKALTRWHSSHAFLRQCSLQGEPIQRIVSVGAPIELMAWRSPFLRRKIPSITQRWYITDTEVNHLAHRLAQKAATDVVLPIHWRSELDGGFVNGLSGIRLHRIDGLHGHVHLRPSVRPSTVSDPPRIMVRRLLGDGIHDAEEVQAIPENTFDGLHVTSADEDAYQGDAWSLDREAASHDGVITQSVTFASEAALLGTPTLLISRAQRGFLDRLQEDGYPLFRWQKECHGEAWDDLFAQYLTGLHLTEALDVQEWPDTRRAFAAMLHIDLID